MNVQAKILSSTDLTKRQLPVHTKISCKNGRLKRGEPETKSYRYNASDSRQVQSMEKVIKGHLYGPLGYAETLNVRNR